MSGHLLVPPSTVKLLADTQGNMSMECMLGIGHFLKCPKPDCTCVCHEMDGERRHKRAPSRYSGGHHRNG